MTSSQPVLLLLGAGSNVGQAVARAFAAKGYKIALASRSLKAEDGTGEQLNIPTDLARPEAVVEAFAKVTEKFQTGPSVVIYNAAALTVSDPENPLSPSPSEFAKDLNINAVSPYVAAQQAVAAFEKLPVTASKTFIYTGNVLNQATMARLLDLGVGKSATAHWIQIAAEAYKGKGYRFYYGDERQPDGSPSVKGVSGEAHAQHYLHLAESKETGPWQQTFVKGAGYRDFAAGKSS